MRLNELTDDILKLVNNSGLSVSVALELCKYSAETQAVIYEKHLSGETTGYYSDWRNLTAKDFIKRLENSYSNDLSRYRFDKSECALCPFNTNCYTLFPDENKEGKCLNINCLTDRNKRYLVDACKKIVTENPAIEICKPVYSNAHEDAFTDLSTQGYDIRETSISAFPEAPKMPKQEDFEDRAGFEEAKDEYYSEMCEYRESMDKIEEMISSGTAKCVVTFRDNAPLTGYARLTDDSEAGTGRAKEASEPTAKLEKQDRRNMEIAVENIVEDTRQLIRKTELPESDFTEFEDKLLYFSMLDDLKREHFALFTESPDKWHLSDEEKIQIINNLTEEQKTVIRRDFLIKRLSDAFGVSKKSYLILEFARLHFLEALAETEAKHNEVYQKRHERIEERLEALKGAQEQEQEQGIMKVA
jgi:ParB family chromosome partitioning protein